MRDLKVEGHYFDNNLTIQAMRLNNDGFSEGSEALFEVLAKKLVSYLFKLCQCEHWSKLCPLLFSIGLKGVLYAVVVLCYRIS